MNENHGYIPAEIKEEDWVFGGENTKLTGDPLLADGNWTAWLPDEEPQAPTFETNACTVFGTLNAIEILHRFKYGGNPNYSDRFIAKGAGVDPLKGATPHQIAEFIRKKGLVPESEWPYEAKTVEEFFAQLPQRLYTLAAEWLGKYAFNHEYVLTNPAALKDALTHSPLGISVNLWPTDDGIYYKPEGQRDSHWVTLINYEDKQWWEIFDSYPPFRKKVKWDTAFEVSKRYHIGTATKLSIISSLLANIRDFLELLFNNPSLLWK